VSHLIPVTTTLLGGHLPLLDLLSDDTALSWVRGDDGLVAWGEHARVSVFGPNRFRDARNWWHEQLKTFSISNSVNGAGTGPILFSSFSFSEDEESILIIPKVVVGKRGNKDWITWIGTQGQPELPTTAAAERVSEFEWQSGSLSASDWKARVAQAIEIIKSDDLDKVVLARDLVAKTDSEIDVVRILRKLAAHYPQTWIFTVAGLVGATPELLLRLNRGMVTSRVLAGTIRKTGDDAQDLPLAASLARSSKDLEEHEYAVRSVAQSLEPFCSSTNVPEAPFVLHLENVMHLATDVTGVITEAINHVDVFTLIEQLHPSAAVCGTPTQFARNVIQNLEGMKRARYAGPVGWIDARGDGEIGIALRCGLIEAGQIRLFAGCGIVAGSNPDDELAESEAKLLPMKMSLERG
jgi:menaquinone-specific isochorismate synthase